MGGVGGAVLPDILFSIIPPVHGPFLGHVSRHTSVQKLAKILIIHMSGYVHMRSHLNIFICLIVCALFTYVYTYVSYLLMSIYIGREQVQRRPPPCRRRRRCPRRRRRRQQQSRRRQRRRRRRQRGRRRRQRRQRGCGRHSLIGGPLRR